MRLLGFERVELAPGASRQVTVTADRRLLARIDGAAGHWHDADGTYQVGLGKAADSIDLQAEARLDEALFGS
jgi:beta-glucosidase